MNNYYDHNLQFYTMNIFIKKYKNILNKIIFFLIKVHIKTNLIY